jgi:cyanophycin synthetase
LSTKAVTTAVFEAARGGILREGCGFDGCDVAVVTNIASGDHLGIAEIDTPEQIAWVKGAIVAAVRPSGAAVLNAADARIAEMAALCDGDVILYAVDENTEALAAHRAAGSQHPGCRNRCGHRGGASQSRDVNDVIWSKL